MEPVKAGHTTGKIIAYTLEGFRLSAGGLFVVFFSNFDSR